MAQLWEVTGGEGKGGIIVREGPTTASARAEERLSTGALIEELHLAGDRLHYRRKTGTGPETGWISITINGKELAKRASQQGPGADGGGKEGDAQAAEAPAKEKFDPYGALGVEPDATDAQIKSAFRKGSLKVHPDKDPSPDAAEQFRKLAHAKDFLLNPLKRLMYNMTHGLQARRHYVQWWSSWDDVFAEIDPAEDEEAEALAADAASPAPSLAPADGRTDVLIFGATGFVGTILCSMLQKGLPGRTWAMAGRDGRKLGMLEEKFGKGPLYKGKLQFECDEDIDSVVRTARLVIDVSGPKYAIGSVVAAACVRSGTHYIDNTSFPGDTLATKKVHEELHEKAKARGVSLIWFCGLGGVIFDVGALLLVRYIREKYRKPTRRVDAYEISHGTNVTGTVLLSAKGEDGFEKKLKQTGYFFLGGEPDTGLKDEDDEGKARPVMDRYAGMWANLSEIPEQITVRCSYGLFKKTENYGPDFRFKIWMLFGDEAAANMNSLRMSNAFLRRGYSKHVELKKIPAPGDGPCERLRKEAVSTRILVAEADEKAPGKGRTAHVICGTGPGGNSDHQEGSSTVIIEIAACILDALDSGDRDALVPGFATPAYHLAHLGIVERLAARGFLFKFFDGAPARELFQNFLASAGALAAS